MTHGSKSRSESNLSSSTITTVFHVYPSDYLMLLPDLLFKRVACSAALAAHEDGGGSSTSPLLGFWCPPAAARFRPFGVDKCHSPPFSLWMLFDIYVYMASCNPHYHSSARWGSPYLLCVSDNEIFPLQKVWFTAVSFGAYGDYEEKG